MTIDHQIEKVKYHIDHENEWNVPSFSINSIAHVAMIGHHWVEFGMHPHQFSKIAIVSVIKFASVSTKCKRMLCEELNASVDQFSYWATSFALHRSSALFPSVCEVPTIFWMPNDVRKFSRERPHLVAYFSNLKKTQPTPQNIYAFRLNNTQTTHWITGLWAN